MLWVFDVNETLLDLAPLDGVFERRTGVAGLRSEWFDLLIRTALVVTATDRYEDFAALGAASARAVARRHGADFDDEAVAELGATIRTLPPHPEVRAALTALRDRGHRLVALGNSPQAVVDAQLAHADLVPPLEAVYSVQRAGVLKPGPRAYRLVLESEGVEPGEAVMVAAHDWDVAGAQAAGMRTVFLTRGHGEPLPSGPGPDVVARDLTEALATDPPDPDR
jgi:2-haloacid dehalogenase